MPFYPNTQKFVNSDDFLQNNLQELPYFRALLRAVEARFYQKYILEKPVLDFGCGDGFFAKFTFSNQQLVGSDIDLNMLLEAKQQNIYYPLILSNGVSLPYQNGCFGSIISNSVLEHILEVDSLLSEISRILKKNGLFLFSVPNQNFTKYLSIAQFLDEINLQGMAERYRKFFNKISRHIHCEPPEVWLKRLDHAGFKNLECWNYFSPTALRTLEWGHYFGLPYWISKKITGHWVNSIIRIFIGIIYKRIYPYYIESTIQLIGTYSFFVNQKS